MKKFVVILLLAALVLALPFLLRRDAEAPSVDPAAKTLVVVTPMNEEIRDAFALAFSRWHAARYGAPVNVDWRVLGGASETMRYLLAEYGPSGNTSHVFDVFFGGGEFEHANAERAGVTVPAWEPGREPVGTIFDATGRGRFPAMLGGTRLRGSSYYGVTLGSFGLCRNADAARDCGLEALPARWADLADPRLFGRVGLADPTKSGSVAKIFELMVQSCCARAVAAGGEAQLDAGFLEGISLLRRIGANARSFSGNAGQVPLETALGVVAAGICIDFYGRIQAERTVLPDGTHPLSYVTPSGEVGVTADPVAVLRDAPHRDVAAHFVEFCLSDAGQRLWFAAPGTPENPSRHALHRLPVVRSFYSDPRFAALLAAENPYAHPVEYHAEWTGRHFGILRDVIKAMCIDSETELKAAAAAIAAHGGFAALPEATRAFEALPTHPYPFTRQTLVGEWAALSREERLALWTGFFRGQYRLAARLAAAPAS